MHSQAFLNLNHPYINNSTPTIDYCFTKTTLNLGHPVSHALWSNELNTIFYGEGRVLCCGAAVDDGWKGRKRERGKVK